MLRLTKIATALILLLLSAVYQAEASDAFDLSIEHNNPCSGETLYLTSKITGSISAPVYRWEGPAGFISSEANPVIPSVTSAKSGVYQLTVRDGITNESDTAYSDIEIIYLDISFLSPGNLNMGVSYVNKSVKHNFRMINNNNHPVEIADYYIKKGSGIFDIQSILARPDVVASKSFIDFTVSFTPEDTIYYDDSLIIITTTPCTKRYAFPVSGNGFEIISNSPCENEDLYLQATLIDSATYEWQGPNNYKNLTPYPVLFNIPSNMSGYYRLKITDKFRNSYLDSIYIYVPMLDISFTNINETMAGYVKVNTTIDIFLNFENRGSDDLLMNEAFFIGGSNFNVSAANRIPNDIASGELSYIRIEFTPDEIRRFNDTLLIRITEPCRRELRIPFTGKGYSLLANSPCEKEVLFLSCMVPEMAQITWNGPNGFSSNQQFPVLPDITADMAGRYFIKIQDTSFVQNDFIDVTVFEQTQVDIVPEDTTAFCWGDSVVLFAEPFNPNYSYQWSTGDKTPYLNAKNDGKYSLVLENENGCKDTAYIDIKVHPPVQVKIIGQTKFCEWEGNAVIGTLDSYSSYHWSNGDTSRLISVSEPGTYTVIVTDGNGCIGSATADVGIIDIEVEYENFEDTEFDTCSITEYKEKVYKVKNLENEKITVSHVEITQGKNFSVTTDPPIPAYLDSQQEMIITVRFKPTNVSRYYDSLNIIIEKVCVYDLTYPLQGKGIISTTVWIEDTLAAEVTKDVCIPVKVKLSHLIDSAITQSFSAIISFDSRLMIFSEIIDADLVNINEQDLKTNVEFRGDNVVLFNDELTIAEICGEVFLAHEIVNPIIIEEFNWQDSLISVKTENGSLKLQGACQIEIRSIEPIELNVLNIYPNPVSDVINIKFDARKNTSAELTVYNIHGSAVQTAVFDLSTGINDMALDTDLLPAGFYMLKIKGNYDLISIPVTVVK